ncbi:hypothetical protein HK103_005298 [Boothiomyces macroporosus]|uniref:Cyclic nucleotide-binding domain-containing protein n=1 Tax=Boothiomyces macroporosus TaxID=261099 RepID=A0AAD5Y7V3_9FUNG|nr:hypothetical protein HK103_005298 [Boothiomyces macroporosus]
MKLNIAEKLESHLVSSIKKDANGIPEPAGNSKVKTRNLEKHIRKRWFFLYRTQQFAVRLSKAYRSITTSNYSRLTQLPILDAGTLTYMLKTQIVEPSEAYIHQIEASLKEPAFKRSPETVSNLEKVLSLRMPDFARYSSNERNFFCQAMQLEKYPKGTILMKENNPATNFYFLLSGQVEVFKFDNGYKLRVQTTNIGKLDKSGKEYRRTRAAVKDSKKECMCSNNCLFQTINDHKRRLPGSSNLLTKFINNGERALVKQKLESALSSVRIFSNHISILEKISGLFQIYNYPKGEVIHHEGGQTFELSWVIDGKCQIVRSVSFHCKNLNGKQIFSIPSGEKETITELELITQTLKPGDWFPDIPLLPDQPTNLKYLGPEKLHKDSYVQLYTKMPPNDKITYYKYSIKADSPVTIATIPLNDFCEIVPKDLLFKFIFTESNTLYPIKELQIQYLQQQSWNMHKQNIVSEILHK